MVIIAIEKNHEPSLIFAFVSLGITLIASIFVVIYVPSGVLLGAIGMLSSIGSLHFSKKNEHKNSRRISITALCIAITLLVFSVLYLFLFTAVY
ncbi:hypothetical protein QGM71_19735 [Virgibacillus sp. C22-A2]|uniref:DUF4190 domain-containing protein n=1 Tax=Virgibacillus tibetensis TaxID=3042313 RepID=A0ABU6KME8_9BACI|nr:hypothetical protein [Virgibacillus sp. C22-A2]